LIEHWDGSSWSIVSSPNKGSNSSQFSAITAVSAKNIWAVGSFQKGSFPGTFQTLVEQWNGSAWTIVKSPNVKALNNSLSAVTATSAHDIWAVGSAFNPSGNTAQTLIEHFNGSQWSIVASPDPSSTFNDLQGVAHVPSSNNTWAVGTSDSNPGKTLTEFFC